MTPPRRTVPRYSYQRVGKMPCQGRLAYASGPPQGDQPHPAVQEPGETLHVVVTAKQETGISWRYPRHPAVHRTV